MAFSLITFGLIFVIAGAQGTQKELGNQLFKDFTGPGNFLFWIASLGIVGAIGYIPQLRTFSRLFMTLIIIAMMVANQGFFDKLSQALKQSEQIQQKAI